MDIEFRAVGEEVGLDVKNISKSKAKELLQQAQDGDVDSMFEVSRLYFGGFQIEQSYEKAVYWSRRAAELGDDRAMVNLAFNLIQGLGTKMNRKEGRMWALRAAFKENPIAQYNVGLYFSRGIGGKKDEKVATRYFRRSAKQGDPAGQTSYGVQLIEGHGVPEQDVESGLEWIYKGMRQDYDFAFYVLGIYAVEGKYVEKNMGLALEYFEWAAKLGHSEAKKIVENWGTEELVVADATT